MTGKELKKNRKLMGLTQAELAEKSGIPLGTIGRIESTDLRIKDVEKLEIFAKIFNNEDYHRIVTYKEIDNKLLSNNEYNVKNGWSDIANDKPPQGYLRNDQVPERDVGVTPSPNEWRQLYFMQQEEINILNRKIELLNKLLQQ